MKNGEKEEVVYKYNGSVCGASFAIPQIAGLFLLSRQIDKDISFDKFIEIVRNPKMINRDGMEYLNAKEIIKQIEIEKNKKEYIITPNQIGKKTINAPTWNKNKTDEVQKKEQENTKDKGDVNLDDN